MHRHTFNQEDVDNAIDYVAREGAQDRGQTKSYSHVFAAAGLPPPQLLHGGDEPQVVTDFMKAFHDRCIERGFPPLDSLVVHVASERKGMPGAGYFKVNRQPDPLGRRTNPEDATRAVQFWERQKAECERWGTDERRAATRT